jgi:hypothetical protein
MRSNVILFILFALVPNTSWAESEAPSYEDAMEDSPSIEQELDEARAVPHFDNGEPADDYGSISDAMDQLSIENGEMVSAPENEVPYEAESAEEPNYDYVE